MSRICLACFICLALTACLPVTSRTPVGATAGFKADAMLLGSWTAAGSTGQAAASLRFLANNDGSMTAILVTNDTEWSEYRLQVAQIGSNRFINAQEVSNNGEAAHGPLTDDHIVLLYRPTASGGLALYQMDEKSAADAIRAGEIAGETEPGENGDVRITADQPALDTFMRSARAEKLFSKELVRLARAK
jgi:hypothetical protein